MKCVPGVGQAKIHPVTAYLARRDDVAKHDGRLVACVNRDVVAFALHLPRETAQMR